MSTDEIRARQRAYKKLHRDSWMAAHPCSCGAPSTTMQGRYGAIPKIWSYSDKVREEKLRDIVIDYWCDACVLKRRDDGRLARNRRQSENHAAWMAAHPCDCGAPSTTMRLRGSTVRMSRMWGASLETIAQRLDGVAIDYKCDACKPAPRVPAEQRSPKTPKPVEPVPLKRAAAKHPPFTGASFPCVKCKTDFPRYALLVRHKRERHAA